VGAPDRLRGVHFEQHHDFAAAPERVALLMTDPDFECGLDLPDLSRPDVVAHEVDGSNRRLKLRYRYVGDLDSFAKRAVGDRQLTWVQDLRIDVDRGVGTLTFSADDDAGRVNGDADVVLGTTGDDDACRRSIAGEFHIRIPLVGGTAEKRIVPGLVRRLDVEAAALAAALAGGAS
jgi:hypothetical protein